MAEAVVERPSVPTRFFCHMCNVEINIPNTDFTCPLCAGGFVEELPAHALPGSSSSAPSVDGGNSTLGSSGGFNASEMHGGFNRLSGLDTLRGEIATLLMSRNGPNVEISIDPDSRRGNLMALRRGAVGNSAGSGSGSTGGGRVRPQNLDRLDNVLLDFLQSLSGAEVDFGQSGMVYMGNLGDYAWGREGIDTIVTQLLNQMETSGPPPLAKDKIAEIPKVEVGSEDVERKLQCSVCWEDFRLEELVRKLSCSHMYHENCIVPWLDLHGTCPICRNSLNGDGGEVVEDVGGAGGVAAADGACPLHRNPASGSASATSTSTVTGSAAAGTATGAPSSTAGGGGGGSTSQTQRNNIFSFDDGNVDLD